MSVDKITNASLIPVNYKCKYSGMFCLLLLNICYILTQAVHSPEVQHEEDSSRSVEINLGQIGFEVKRNLHFLVDDTCDLVVKIEQIDGTKLVGHNSCPSYKFDEQNVMKNGVCQLALEFLPYDVHYELCFCLISSQYSKGCYSGQIAVEKVKQRPQNAKPIEFQIIDYEVCSAKCNA